MRSALHVLSLSLALLAGPAFAQVEVSVSTDRETYWAADTVRIAITATNTADTTVTLRFDSGLQAAFEVSGATGPFYCAFTQEPTELRLAPGEAHTWGGEGDDRPEGGLGCYDLVLGDTPGLPPAPGLEPGRYTLVGYVLKAGGERYGTARTAFSVHAADTLDARGYFPLAVGNEWEYRHDLLRPRGESRTEYLRFRVVETDSSVGGFALVEERHTADGALLARDTSSVRYTVVPDAWGGGTEYLCVAARETRPDGEVYEQAMPFFACDLDFPLTGPDGSGHVPPGQMWMIARRLDSHEVDYWVPPFLAGVPADETKEFIHMGGASFIAVHKVGFVRGGFHGDGCQFLCDGDDWTLTYARVGGVEYGARAVASSPPPEGPVGVALAVSPNPTGGRLRIAVGFGGAGPVTVSVYDALGRRVSVVHDGPLAAGETAFDVDASALPAGLYLVRVSAEASAQTVPVTVVR